MDLPIHIMTEPAITYKPLKLFPSEPMEEWQCKFFQEEAEREVGAALTRAFYEGLIE